MGMDISKQIYSYISELNGLEEKKLTLKIDRGHKQTERRTRVTIYFDAAFDKRSSKSISGLVIRDVGGEILASNTVIHIEVPYLFAQSENSGGFKNGNKEMPNYRSQQISYWGTHQRYSQQKGRRTLPVGCCSKLCSSRNGETAAETTKLIRIKKAFMEIDSRRLKDLLESAIIKSWDGDLKRQGIVVSSCCY
ncbi:hypothetical protein Gotri_007880 [Gossypium trilobum]|uniref:Uncharacterized protein n=1 Tax=Gossypium trilobum TaxID=34281 RepID=A0A7J9EHJ6_9ROSI|nr:hypothetical protein [Gossypium trilobum]